MVLPIHKNDDGFEGGGTGDIIDFPVPSSRQFARN